MKALEFITDRLIYERVIQQAVPSAKRFLWLATANLTGAGMGAKSDRRRNFESGFVTTTPDIVSAIMEQFDHVWMGAECAACGRRQYCPDPPER